MALNEEKEKAKLPKYMEIRRQWISGKETYRSLGEKHNLSHEAIRNVVKGRVGVLEGQPDLTRRPPDEVWEEQPRQLTN